MTISTVEYTSRKQAEQLRGTPFVAVISITDPGTPEATLDPLFRHVLRLAFYDAVPADEYLPAHCPACSIITWPVRSVPTLKNCTAHRSTCR
jgi:hypothetical protein